jgi:hypothetical protein
MRASQHAGVSYEAVRVAYLEGKGRRAAELASSGAPLQLTDQEEAEVRRMAASGNFDPAEVRVNFIRCKQERAARTIQAANACGGGVIQGRETSDGTLQLSEDERAGCARIAATCGAPLQTVIATYTETKRRNLRRAGGY